MPYKLPHQTLLTIHTRPNLSAFKSTSFHPKQSPSTATAIPLLEHCFTYLKALIAFTCDFIYLSRMYFVWISGGQSTSPFDASFLTQNLPHLQANCKHRVNISWTNMIIYKQHRRCNEGHKTGCNFFNFSQEKWKLQLTILRRWALVTRRRESWDW